MATRLFRRLRASNLDRTFCAAATTAAAQGLYGKIPGIAIEDYQQAAKIFGEGLAGYPGGMPKKENKEASA